MVVGQPDFHYCDLEFSCGVQLSGLQTKDSKPGDEKEIKITQNDIGNE